MSQPHTHSLRTLFFRFAGHQWRETIRSPYLQKNILINIFLGLAVAYLIINLILLGVFLGRILLSVDPDTEPFVKLSGFLFYYFLADFLLRFLMQPSPAMKIAPYLHLPVKKSSLFHFILIKSGLSLFNFVPLIIFVPFAIGSILPWHGMMVTVSWILAVILMIFSVNYLAFLAKKMFPGKPLLIPVLITFFLVAAWMDLKAWNLFGPALGDFLVFAAGHPFALIPAAALPVLLCASAWWLLYRKRYIETESVTADYRPAERDGYLSGKFGTTGALISLEMKMILRNNRPRTYLVLSALFMLYGFMFYPRMDADFDHGMMLFIGLLLTGIMMIQYGQLVLSWESSYFDRLVTARLTMHDFFLAKFRLFLLFNTLAFIFTSPYAFYDLRILYVNLAAWLFNSGVGSFMVLYMGTYNTRQVNLGRSALFNYEGVSAVHFIFIFPVMGLPFLLYWLVSLVSTPMAGIVATGLAGFAGLIFHRQWLNIVERQFSARKQKILHGFRNG